MTLATIALFSMILSAASDRPVSAGTAAGQSATQPAPADKPADASATPAQATSGQESPGQQSAPQATKPPAAKKPAAQAATGQGHATAAKRPRRKKVVNANCLPAPAATGSSASSADPVGATPPTGDPAQPASTSSPGASAPPTSAPGTSGPSVPTNCPPSKIIVRQGGTSEPSIQLAGGPGGDQAGLRRHTAQLLGATEENLKKITGHPLSPDQQSMVARIHQFTDQSKTAAAAGDLDRADTLALKAQLLSEELAKPQ